MCCACLPSPKVNTNGDRFTWLMKPVGAGCSVHVATSWIRDAMCLRSCINDVRNRSVAGVLWVGSVEILTADLHMSWLCAKVHFPSTLFFLSFKTLFCKITWRFELISVRLLLYNYKVLDMFMSVLTRSQRNLFKMIHSICYDVNCSVPLYT